jgi:aldehyde dehydrogenase
VNGKVLQAAHSTEDLELAVDHAHYNAFQTWGETSVTEINLLNKNKLLRTILNILAIVETIDNGKAIRETMAADLPYGRSFRYFASVIRAEESTITELDSQTVSIALSGPLGLLHKIIPWIPILMAVWSAPALAAGNAVDLKPAEVHNFNTNSYGTCGDLLPAGVVRKHCKQFGCLNWVVPW